MKPEFSANYLAQRNTKKYHFFKFQSDNKLCLKYLHMQILTLVSYNS